MRKIIYGLRLFILFACFIWLIGLVGVGETSGAAAAEVTVRALIPASDFTGRERVYSLALGEPIARAKLISVEDESGAKLYENIPMRIEGGVFASTQAAITLPSEGDYRFLFGMSRMSDKLMDASGDVSDNPETSFFTATVRSRASVGR